MRLLAATAALAAGLALAATAAAGGSRQVCGGACDGGGGVVPGGWCSTPGQYGTWNGVVLRCDSGHTWRYA